MKFKNSLVIELNNQIAEILLNLKKPLLLSGLELLNQEILNLFSLERKGLNTQAVYLMLMDNVKVVIKFAIKKIKNLKHAFQPGNNVQSQILKYKISNQTIHMCQLIIQIYGSLEKLIIFLSLKLKYLNIQYVFLLIQNLQTVI
jgi:hypothetical protein